MRPHDRRAQNSPTAAPRGPAGAHLSKAGRGHSGAERGRDCRRGSASGAAAHPRLLRGRDHRRRRRLDGCHERAGSRRGRRPRDRAQPESRPRRVLQPRDRPGARPALRRRRAPRCRRAARSRADPQSRCADPLRRRRHRRRRAVPHRQGLRNARAPLRQPSGVMALPAGLQGAGAGRHIGLSRVLARVAAEAQRRRRLHVHARQPDPGGAQAAGRGRGGDPRAAQAIRGVAHDALSSVATSGRPERRRCARRSTLPRFPCSDAPRSSR